MKGIHFIHRFDTADVTPDNNCIVIEHGNGTTDVLTLTNVMAVKVATMRADDETINSWAVLTHEAHVTCVYRIQRERVIICQYKGGEHDEYDNHWGAGYDAFVRTGGWAGNMNLPPEPTHTNVITVQD